jgi:hypothetical protein
VSIVNCVSMIYDISLLLAATLSSIYKDSQAFSIFSFIVRVFLALIQSRYSVNRISGDVLSGDSVENSQCLCGRWQWKGGIAPSLSSDL